MHIDLRHGDCRTVMATMEPESVDAIVTDPPYGLSLMGKEWDHGVPGVAFWAEALRVAKPGAHLLSFGGTRTFHRLAVAIEDAGWEIRDCIMWVYGSGFPKSHNVSKAIESHEKFGGSGTVMMRKAVMGEEYTESVAKGTFRNGSQRTMNSIASKGPEFIPSTDAAKEWDGWGTALKPAWEPIIVARKPLIGTVAENVLSHGTGAINVDRCRVGTDVVTINTWDDGAKPFGGGAGHTYSQRKVQGRWPANVLHDGSDDTTAGMGGASRYFYSAKTGPSDRNDGCNNSHPTVKPTDLMTWLCQLVTPPGGVVLDPFCGSGSTGRGAKRAGASKFLGIELDAEYIEIARRRIEALDKDRLIGL
jgi:predicted RNA methylase